ncbi:MAG: tyrosine--tRNA ligase [Candidatus Fluviicola riflensis]|nr:MAG: tyrosine--tRNA ligase [Candidatus Fluviicola riflensis]OGS76865.1 MAG: tyrosine--tRNA ligase [Candidatus Fluviicola riflensis]OGS81795.1 MAG: tyrosine--tRNA ligase [Fluviicola sp. RIFCSPHIGHO2_01_FULL_43_53]OGS88594.1 MAG: tyrosine--tRNA ligase [Fluviicola sp. RIFCSPHIGHO2_12_FULL_43_24]
MQHNVIEELRWRGMIQDIMPGLEEQLLKEMTAGYVGFDPTSDSLHVGNLLPIMLLKHFQLGGHKPFALVGGATGMVGDPSGKSAERNLLDEATLQHNVTSVEKQLKRFLDFENGENKAELVNNYDWMKDFSFLEFIRDVGKYITVNYMMAKDSVKKRIETGISFTEFSYQLLQGYDFLHLYQNNNVKVQFGGSDQWGNITTGTELVRKKAGGEAYAFTCPLLTKADGGKFGKTESGTVWLDAEKTSPYEFYQFWLKTTDADIPKLMRFYSLKSKAEIEAIEAEHNQATHLRTMQRALAEEVTERVHGKEALEAAIAATNILFGKSTTDDLKKLNERDFLSVFEGVKQATVTKADLSAGISIVELLGSRTGFLSSNGEAKRELKGNAISVNKEKVQEGLMVDASYLINDKYILIGKGKSTNFIVVAE